MTAATKHAHSWEIESPNGEFSTGRCSCGAEKQFYNYREVQHFNGSISQRVRECVICGDKFHHPHPKVNTCGDECKAEQSKRRRRAASKTYRRNGGNAVHDKRRAEART